MPAAPPPTRLTPHTQAALALGDHTVNIQLATVSLFFLYFLTEVAGLPPAWAGLVLWIGRAVDAVTDPAMGRLSDQTQSRWGRRRPYFLAGALPFGVTLALLWSVPPVSGAGALFAWYTVVYVANTLCSTLLAVPYMALLPELALDYQERTSLNAWRMVGVLAAIALAAVGMPALVATAESEAAGYARAGLCLGVWVALPWLLVHRVSFERPGFARPSAVGFRAGLRRLARHASFRRLGALFLVARIALDVVGAMLIFYFAHWLGRKEDFPIAMGVMLATVVLALPLWLRLARRIDKRSVFMAAVLWWAAAQTALWWLEPESPRALVFALMALAGIGYGVADLMPWSMLGDVIDEDELLSGERRDGLYAGVFTFLRKLGGASGVAVAGLLLQLVGFERGAERLGPQALDAIRALTTLAPAVLLVAAAALALRYPIGRSVHAAILGGLAHRRSGAGAADGAHPDSVR